MIQLSNQNTRPIRIALMKFLIFSLVIAYALAFSQMDFVPLQTTQQNPPACRDTKYGNQGEKCVPGSDSKLQCKQFLSCVDNTCKPGYIGAYCEKHSDCYLSSSTEEGIKCINSKCTKKRYNGFACSMNDDCHSTMCTEGKCVGYLAGETCDPYQPVQCDKGLYCSWNGAICVAQKQIGDRCEDYQPSEIRDIPEGSNYMVICPGGSQCIKKVNATRSTCVEVYSRKEGESCEQMQNCYPGSVCRQGKCVRRVFGDVACPGTRNCTSSENERCVCINGETATCKTTANTNCGFQNAMNEWTDCWKRNNCHWERNIFTAMLTEMWTKDTCMGASCGHIPRAALCCRNSGFDWAAYSTASLVGVQCSSSSALVAVIVIIILVLIASVAVSATIVGVWLWKKRRNASFETLE